MATKAKKKEPVKKAPAKPKPKARPKAKAASVRTDAERQVSRVGGVEFVRLPHLIDPVPLTPELRDQLAKDHDEQRAKLAAAKEA